MQGNEVQGFFDKGARRKYRWGYIILWIVYGKEELKKRHIGTWTLVGTAFLFSLWILGVLFLAAGMTEIDARFSWAAVIAVPVVVLLWRMFAQRKIREEKDMRN